MSLELPSQLGRSGPGLLLGHLSNTLDPALPLSQALELRGIGTR